MNCNRIIVSLATVAASLAPGFGGTNVSSARAADKAVVVDGSSTVFRISKAAQEGFAAVDSDVTVVVDNHGTGGGFGRYARGEVDIVDASRAAKPSEEADAKAKGFEWTRYIVGHDGLTVAVPASNTFLKELSVAQLKALWEPSSKIKTWKDLNPSYPDRKIVFYSPDNDSGTFEFFLEAIIGKEKGQRKDVQQSADDNTLVRGVAGEANGIGYFGYAYFAANSKKLRAVPIKKDDASPAVAPSPATVKNQSYTPLSRPLYIYVKKQAMRRPEVARFVGYYLDHVAELAVMAKYVEPTPADIAANKQARAGATAATPKAR